LSARPAADGPPRKLVLRTDGAARGNPGPAAAGVVVEDARGRALARLGRLLGRATSNEAEYRAVIIALGEAQRLGAKEVELRTDSELLARQLNGVYRVRAPNLKPLHAEARALLGGFAASRVRHVPREENREADRLANRALDAGSDVDD
jgi:ribonuclease HI